MTSHLKINIKKNKDHKEKKFSSKLRTQDQFRIKNVDKTVSRIQGGKEEISNTGTCRM